MILLKLKGSPFNINIIQVYAPTSAHPDEDNEAFYESIDKCMKYVKSAEVNIILGDFNAKVGSETSNSVGNYGIGVTNERGKRLVNFAEQYNLSIINTWFQQPMRRLYTWKSPGDIRRNQLDYILVNQRFKNSVKQARAYPGADINSDHNPVIMKMNIKLKKTKKGIIREHFYMNMLRDTETKERYAIEVENCYNTVLNIENPAQEGESSEEKIDKDWENISKSMTQAASNVLPKKKKEARQDWMTPEILKKMEQRQKWNKKDKVKYVKLNREIEKDCKLAKENWWIDQCEEIEHLERYHKSREKHDKIKKITSNKKRQRADKSCIYI